jgi:hypothetical protein
LVRRFGFDRSSIPDKAPAEKIEVRSLIGISAIARLGGPDVAAKIRGAIRASQ